MESEWLSSDRGAKPREDGYLLGLYGRRRKCLVFTLTIFLSLVTINLALSLWMWKVLNISLTGVGSLQILPGGQQLRGKAMVFNKLVASSISSRRGHLILLESSENITLIARSADSRVNSKLFLGDNQLNFMASTFKISDLRGRSLFSVENKQAVIGAEILRVSGEGGAVLEGSVQTPVVKPDAGQPLRLESPTRSLNIFGLHGVSIESRAGDLSASCLTDMKLQSKEGAIKLAAPNIYLPTLPTAETTKQKPQIFHTNLHKSHASANSDKKSSEVYQVCVCAKGRLFLAPAEEPCVGDNDVCR